MVISPLVAQTGFTDTFQTGAHSFEASVGHLEQHNLPHGPRSMFEGERLAVAWRRFTEPRTEKGLELSLSTLENHTLSSKAWDAAYTRRQYFRVRDSYALHWNVGIGLCHLTNLVPEAGAHTNFVEHAGVGAMHRTGSNSALTLDYRFTHISNASRRDPNIGINSTVLSVGWRVMY